MFLGHLSTRRVQNSRLAALTMQELRAKLPVVAQVYSDLLDDPIFDSHRHLQNAHAPFIHENDI